MHETHAPEDIQRVRELLFALVVIPSVKPPGDESAVASLLEGRLQAAGFETRTAAAHPHRPNLVARRNGSGVGPTLLLNGHMDVQPPGHPLDPGSFCRRDARHRALWPWCHDMQAGLRAIVFADAKPIAERAPGKVGMLSLDTHYVIMYLLAGRVVAGNR